MFRLIAIVIAILCSLTLGTLGAPREVGNKQVYDCAVNYLKESESLDDHFKYKPNVTDDSDCKVMIALIFDKIYSHLKALFDDDKDFANHSECIVEKLKTFAVADLYLENFVYNHDKIMSKLHHQRAITNALSVIEYKLDLAEELCVPEKLFGERFDDLYSDYKGIHNYIYSNSTEGEDDGELVDFQEDYCKRKIMLEKDFIDLNVYNVTVNPSNINVTDLDCNPHWFQTVEEYCNTLKDEIFYGIKAMSKRETRCVADKIRNGNYAEQLLKVWILSELKPSEAQLTEEKTKFITFMKKLYVDIMSCEEIDTESETASPVDTSDVILKNIEFKNLF